MQLRHNRTFMYVSDFLILALLALGALGCTGEWGRAVSDLTLETICRPQSRACYTGAPFTLIKFVFTLHAPLALLAWPIYQVFSALLVLFKPAWKSFGVLLLGFATLLLYLNSYPVPYQQYEYGSGQYMANFSLLFLVAFSLPLAVAEQTELHPNLRRFFG